MGGGLTAIGTTSSISRLTTPVSKKTPLISPPLDKSTNVIFRFLMLAMTDQYMGAIERTKGENYYFKKNCKVENEEEEEESPKNQKHYLNIGTKGKEKLIKDH